MVAILKVGPRDATLCFRRRGPTLPTKPRKMDAYVGGYTAADRGLPYDASECITSVDRIEWARGWCDARDDGDSTMWV